MASQGRRRVQLDNELLFDKSQLMRGNLEGCILKIISIKTTYGYEILEYLRRNGFESLTEGTIYPLVLRLEKIGYVRFEMRASPLGPQRKYYSITDKGTAYLEDFQLCWRRINESVKNILSLTEEQE